LEDAHTMSATQTPTPAPSAEDAFAAAVQDLAAGMHAPEGAPPAAETPAAPPETPPAPAEGDRGTPPTPPAEEIKPPAPDWEARISELERKHENDRRADIARLNAERQRAETAERERDEARQRSADEVDGLFQQAIRQYEAQGDTANAERLQRALDDRTKDRALAAETARREAAERRAQQFEAHFTEAQAAQLAARTPGVMEGALPHLLDDLVAEHPDVDRAALEQRARAWLERPSVRQRMAGIIPVPSDPRQGVHNPRFDDLVADFRDHGASHAESLVAAAKAQAAAARDTLAPKVAMEGGGPGGAAPRAIKVMDDVTADDWRAALERG
jgi:hypothetical protein